MVADSKVTPGRERSTVAKKKTAKARSSGKKVTRKANQNTRPLSADNQNQQQPDVNNDARSQAAISTAVNSQNTQNASGNSAVSWMALGISVLALCAGGYAWYLSAVVPKINSGYQESRFGSIEQRVDSFTGAQSDLTGQIGQIRNQITQTESDFSDRMRALRTEISAQETAVKEQISNSEGAIASQTDGFRQEFTTLSDSIIKLRSELGRSVDSWTLEEVEQLLVIANQRLEFAGEVDLAKQALQLADNRLGELADPSLDEVQKLLAVEINALDNVETVDTAGILNKLSALSDSVAFLPLVGDVTISQNRTNTDSETDDTIPQATTDTATGVEKYTKPIVDAGAAFLTSLGDLIQVEKNGKSMKPVISAEVRQLTYEKAHLILESAQIAFVRQDSELFQDRVGNARVWIEKNFDRDAENTQKWLLQLDSIGVHSPQTEMPDISGSLNAIRDVIKSQN